MLAGLLVFIFVCCLGFYGVSLDEGISKRNRKYEGRYLSMRPLRCSIWGFGGCPYLFKGLVR